MSRTSIASACTCCIQANIVQAGLDYLAAVDLRNAISAAFGCTLTPTAVFDYPSAAALAGAILAASPQQQQQQQHGLAASQPAALAGLDVPAVLAGILQEVLGTVPTPHQPLMEVWPSAAARRPCLHKQGNQFWCH